MLLFDCDVLQWLFIYASNFERIVLVNVVLDLKC